MTMLSSVRAWSRYLFAVPALVVCSTACQDACSDRSDLVRSEKILDSEFGEHREVGWLKDGKRHGRWVAMWGGHKSEIQHWYNGVQHGPEIGWHDNGHVSDDKHFEHGQLHGRWRMFSEQGKLISLGWFKRGRQEGIWCEWDANDRLEEIAGWRRGKKVEASTYPDRPCPLLEGPGRRHLDPDDSDYH